ncbi:TPA: hypothetical protein I7665_18310 [Vibrio vulnificus]|nr:hypothetical protein [Vibrio vulnificus]HAS8124060.1 hypothetical protein [Vibrio vulnificus]
MHIRLRSFDSCLLALCISLLASFLLNNKFIFEGASLLVAFFLLTNVVKIIYILCYFIVSFANPESFLANVMMIYYFLSLEFVLRRVSFDKKIKLKYLLFFLVAFVLYTIYLDIKSGLYRPVSIFSGPLALGYFLCSMAIIFMGRYKRFGFLAVILPLLSGSRSTSLLIIPFIDKRMLKKASFFVPIALGLIFYYFQDVVDILIRSITFNASSDGGRFDSWFYFTDFEWDLHSILFGFGRGHFGSLGHALGFSDAVVIESSVLVLFASYGFIFGSLWVFVFLLSAVLGKNKIIWLMFFVVSLFSVFHDSLGVIIFVLISFSYFESSREGGR